MGKNAGKERIDRERRQILWWHGVRGKNTTNSVGVPCYLVFRVTWCSVLRARAALLGFRATLLLWLRPGLLRPGVLLRADIGQRVDPLVGLGLRFLLGESVPFLYFADEAFMAPGDVIQVIVGQPF